MTLIFWPLTFNSNSESTNIPCSATSTSSEMVAIFLPLLLCTCVWAPEIAQCTFMWDYANALESWAEFLDTQLLKLDLRFQHSIDDNNLSEKFDYIEKRVQLQTSNFPKCYNDYSRRKCIFHLTCWWVLYSGFRFTVLATHQNKTCSNGPEIGFLFI